MESVYEVHELIGEGSFGRVYRARCRRTNDQVAYKVISKNGRSSSEVQALRRECEIQKSLGHPNIIRMLHSFENDDELVVITEFAQKDLCHILKEEGVLGEIRARKIVCDLVSALYYLHSNRILHRDLKPQNVLLDRNGNAKLCDFGFAKVLCKDSQMLTSIKGTPLYMAPELMHEHPYDHNADLWSLGCIVYELVTGRPPYTTSSILKLIKMVKFQPINWPQYLSEACLSFLKGLLDKNPCNRLTWPYLLYHPFINWNTYSNSPLPPGYARVLPQGSVPRFSVPTNVSQIIHSRVLNIVDRDNNKYIPSHIIEIKDRRIHDLDNSHIPDSLSQSEGSTPDLGVQAQKEEWLECLRKTISSVMYDGDVEEVIEKHSLMLIMNTLNTYSDCPVIITTVARLLSLPFVVESISDAQLCQIKETYASCNVMLDLLLVVQNILSSREKKKLNFHQETAFQQILLLICNLTFTDDVFLQKFFKICVSLNLFRSVKIFLSIRTKNDPLSVVKYVISIFMRLYIYVPQSRQFVLQSFENCTAEFHSLLQRTEDMKVHLKLCTFVTVLGCTQSNFLRQSPDINELIEDLNKLTMNSNSPSAQQVFTATLEVLKNVNRAS